MKIKIWVLLGLLLLPYVVFSQSTLPTTTIDSNHQTLLAFEQDTLKRPDDFVPYDKEPEVIKQFQPKYPELALKDRLEGNVYVKVWITESGDVKKAEIVKSDREIFNTAALEASTQWKFTPAKQKGRPIAVWVTIPFRFKLSTEKTMPEIFESIKAPIENVLKGGDITQAKKDVSPDAYLIYGKYYENLYGVLNGEHKDIKLIEGPESKTLAPIIVRSSPDEMIVYIVLKTQSKKNGPIRFHTVVLMKTEKGEWQIKHWHVSW